jgi:DNA helicase-2/ATP-dependent DNA helicase PcrA
MREMIGDQGLSTVVSRMRHLGDPNEPCPPGLHLLNAHLGKGQQFDKVIVLGMEDGHIPDFRATTEDELREELSVLHVMTSRARTSLIFTVCNDVPHSDRPWIRQPSRWLSAIEQHIT